MKSCLSYDLMEDANFLEEILPRIITLIKYEIGNSSDNKKYERIKFCITYVQLHINDLPVQYKVNNFSYLFIDMIEDIQNLIASLKNNLLNQFYHKIRGGDKLNLFFSKYSSQINLMEKYYIINYIFHKIAPKNILNEINSGKGKQEKNINSGQKAPTLDKKDKVQPPSSGNSISEFIKKFRDYTKNSMEIDDLLLEEKKEGIPKMIKEYFNEINILLKEEKIIDKYSPKEQTSICHDLENYILLKLSKKLFPIYPSKSDIFIYEKCERLNFLKPENIKAKNKNINTNLLLEAIDFINNIDLKFTPADKIKMFEKAFEISINSISFSSGKSKLGVDDVTELLIYVMIKAKPQMIYSNYIFCKNYLNPELEKTNLGSLLTQMGFVIKIICNMKYEELNGVTQEEFGLEKELPSELINFCQSIN